MSETTAWRDEVGQRPHRVVVEERLDRKGVVYLRWRERGNWAVEATGIVVRNKGGDLVKVRQAEALRLGKAKAVELAEGRPGGKRKRPLTISQGLQLAIDPEKGKYPADSMHRREVIRELGRVVAILDDPTWNSLRPGDIRKVYRTRAKALALAGHVGKRGAEVTVARLLAVAEWLRGEGEIDAGACHAPKEWKKTLGEEVTDEPPKQPRYTLEELRAILGRAADVDPRFALIAYLGVGLRLGQVARVMRSKVDLNARLVKVPGRGRKGGATVALLDDDVRVVEAALAGYLAPLETQYQEGVVRDYPLFPQGQLTGGKTDPRTARCRPEQAHAASVRSETVRQWWEKAEALAGITKLSGRATYGGKRQTVDAAKELKISRDELASLGGWGDTQMADRIYADQEARVAAEGAARARAAIRGNLELVTPET